VVTLKLNREQLMDLLFTKPRNERIATLRSLYNLNQKALGGIANVHRGTVSLWEREGEDYGPGKMARSRMSTYFNLPPYVFTDEWGAPEVRKDRRKRKAPPTLHKALEVPPPNPFHEEEPVKRIG
jgi:transcriptional regulator with XRE-family HTH domain